MEAPDDDHCTAALATSPTAGTATSISPGGGWGCTSSRTRGHVRSVDVVEDRLARAVGVVAGVAGVAVLVATAVGVA